MTDAGPCRVRLVRAPDAVHVEVTGAQAPEVEAQVLAGLQQDRAPYAPAHPLLKKLHRRAPTLRLVRVPWLFDVCCSAVLQQRVTTLEAMRQWRTLASTLGAEVEGGLRAFPSAATLAKVPTWRLESIGIDLKRARTLVLLARELSLHPLRAHHDFAALRARLDRVRGVGPWTREMVLGFGAGDPDAVVVGDLHLPHLVCRALGGDGRGSDARMLELLEPERGHRFRAVRLLSGARLR
jgi:3-methyladenine DNA glycosylase/8-oxoguanine DNA glycosylase